MTLQGEQSAVLAEGLPPQQVEFDAFALKRLVTTKLDMADLVMGGDGTTGRRDLGLHTLTGQYLETIARDESLVGLNSTGRLQPVSESPFVAGVFIPSKDGILKDLPMGLTLPTLPETNGTGYGTIWSGGMMPSLTRLHGSIPAKLPGYNFVGAGQPAMIMHTNAGLVLDLDVIRTQNPGMEIIAFQAVVGNASGRASLSTSGFRSEFLIYVDGNQFMHQTFVRTAPDEERVAIVDLPLTNTNRYLTLISADGGDDSYLDWIVLGNPLIVLQPLENRTPDF